MVKSLVKNSRLRNRFTWRILSRARGWTGSGLVLRLGHATTVSVWGGRADENHGDNRWTGNNNDCAVANDTVHAFARSRHVSKLNESDLTRSRRRKPEINASWRCSRVDELASETLFQTYNDDLKCGCLSNFFDNNYNSCNGWNYSDKNNINYFALRFSSQF